MIKRTVFIFCAVLASAACATGTSSRSVTSTPHPSMMPPSVPEAPHVSPPPETPATQPEAPDTTGRIPLADGRAILLTVPDGWNFMFSIDGVRAAQRSGFPGPYGVLQDDAIESQIVIVMLNRTTKNAREEAQDLATKLRKANGSEHLTTGRVIALVEDKEGATFDVIDGNDRGFVTVRHLGAGKDVPVVFMGCWQVRYAGEALKAYWPTVFGTDVR